MTNNNSYWIRTTNAHLTRMLMRKRARASTHTRTRPTAIYYAMSRIARNQRNKHVFHINILKARQNSDTHSFVFPFPMQRIFTEIVGRCLRWQPYCQYKARDERQNC